MAVISIVLMGAMMLAGQEPLAPSVDDTRLVVSTRPADEQVFRRLQAQLGVVEVEQTSAGPQVWTLPESRVLEAFRTLRASRAVDAVDYAGDDFRTLLLGVPQGLLNPQEAAQVETLEALPGVTEVVVQRNREDGLSTGLLENAYGRLDGLSTDGGFLLDLPGRGRVLAVGAPVGDPQVAAVWSGVVADGDPAVVAGDAVLNAVGGRIRGTLSFAEDGYLILPLGVRGYQAVARIDVSQLPDDHARGEMGGVFTGTGGAAPARPVMPGGRPVISIGVVWTAGAEAQALGMGSDIRDGVEIMIAAANAGLRQSGATFELAHAGARRIDGTETNDMAVDVSALMNRSDGRWDDVHAWRDRVKADIIILLRTNNEDCGRAAAINAGEAQAFAVVSYYCGLVTYTLSHELGHLLGARHLDDDRDLPTPLYARGYLHGREWRTIMVDKKHCPTCGRLNHWANPDVQLRGVPSGVAGRFEDIRVINGNAARVASYR